MSALLPELSLMPFAASRIAPAGRGQTAGRSTAVILAPSSRTARRECFHFRFFGFSILANSSIVHSSAFANFAAA